MNPQTTSFIRFAKHPLKFRMFLFSKLPSAYFAGVRIKELDEKHCTVTVPYKWFSKNPFRSTYFACLSMAAELSTGSLAMSQVFRREPAVSMLVIKAESSFFKKATGTTSFTCEDGELMRIAVDESIATGEPRSVQAKSIGKNKDGEIVAEFHITWSFKAKKNRPEN